MASIIKVLSFFLVVAFLVEGGTAYNCKTSDIILRQNPTGRSGPKGAEYSVEVVNNCACSQFNLIVACHGFNSNTHVDQRWLKPVGGGNCIVNSGYAIIRGFNIGFFYVGPTKFSLTPKKSDVRCP
ncbi:hypothetical protein C5167_006775 [Papaver somniferum]|uniref:Uncharacterized protein n=1 Tax=Papaver somniferum TaxID=3469 RepID=A0A4Y7JHR4_PAPSO|nr:uncharacterized protein LOC113274327 [Papaver somniferum]RZC59481.1 hypothetical protein C5167_006775 [Papaver somniferum]